MFASTFGAQSFCIGGGQANNDWLAALVALLAAGLVAIVTVLLAYDGHLAAKTRAYNAQLKDANAQLQHAATHDSLTGLPNRILLSQSLDALIRAPQRPDRWFAVLLIDLDNFKEVNDSLGHLAGDQLLRTVSSRMASQLRTGDLMARLGGDEFVVLADGLADPSEATGLAARLQRIMAEPVELCGINIHVSASIGISIGPGEGLDSVTMLKRADAAMYHVKNNGRSGYQLFSTEVQMPSRERLEVHDGLCKALSAHQFELHYQPKVDVRTGRIEGAEALIRWRHPTRGLVPPGLFIPLAEETGLIVPIGEWALREACRQIHAWQYSDVGPLRVAVNVSAQQFARRDFAETVRRIVREFSLDPGLLELELTESAVMRDPKSSIDTVRRLTDLGISVSLDDFGTGYSSLSYLRRLPLHKLKIDRSFIQDLGVDGSSAQIVRATLSLGHNLNMKVIA